MVDKSDFYTSFLGLLNKDILNSGYSLFDARILLELDKVEETTANGLIGLLEATRAI